MRPARDHPRQREQQGATILRRLGRRVGAPVACALALLLGACAGPPPGPSEPRQAGPQPGYPKLGRMLPVGHTRYANATLADLFVRLTHDLEWGQRRPHLVRYDVPVAVGVSGSGAASYTRFLDRYLAELRSRTGIQISRTPAPHNLMIRFVKGSDYRSKIPRHICVVAPGALDWATFRQDPVKYGTRAFERQRKLTAMTVFIPDNAAPWLVRSCLVEEIAQALGPANDLYGLGPSIFNDDGAHVWPTELDFLMLRVLYRPGMTTGMSRTATRRQAKAILDSINPQGRTAPALPRLMPREMQDWAEQLTDAFAYGKSDQAKRRAANRALAIATRRAPGSIYHCHSLTALARTSRSDPAAEIGALERAERICARAHGPGDIRLVRLRLERARATYRAGRASAAVGLSEGLETPLAGHGQDERLTALYALQAAALRAIQQGTRSFAARRQAGAWGAYSLGRDHPDVRRLLTR